MKGLKLAAVSLLLSGTALAAPARWERVGMPPPASPAYGEPANATPALPIPCKRACMEDVAARFLKALATRDPQSLPLAGTVRYTEMGQELELGDGLWAQPAMSAPTATYSPIPRPARSACSRR